MSLEFTQRGRRDSFDQLLASEDIIPCEPLPEAEWGAIRRRALFRLLRHFVNWWNPKLHRGFFPELAGYAWGAIYRSMLVPAISATAFRNEGHFRAKGRTSGTESFFSAALRYSRDSPALRQSIRAVNLRHHVAGVANRIGDRVEVQRHYETAFAYVSTAFIEAIRRGYAAHGVAPDSPAGRLIAEDLCAIFYQVAGMVGLARMPRNLEAHEKFRDSYDEFLRTAPRSSLVQNQARELSKRIFPFTAALAGVSLEEQLNRYLDPETAAYLFPDPAVLQEMRPMHEEMLARFRGRHQSYGLRLLRKLFAFTAPAVEDEEDLEPLWKAYRAAPDDSAEARLIGAILLQAIEERGQGKFWHIPVTLRLQRGEALLKQGEVPKFCYVLLKSRQPLLVTSHGLPGHEPGEEVELARYEAPTVLGEIAMWRNIPAIASVVCQCDEELEVVRIDQRDFDSLKTTPGFWSAAAAQFLSACGEGIHNPKFQSLLLLLRFVNGDSTVDVSSVPGVDSDPTVSECIDLLHATATELRETYGDDPETRVALENLLHTLV
jgi:tetratricopeptide (TPR) repeat protein